MNYQCEELAEKTKIFQESDGWEIVSFTVSEKDREIYKEVDDFISKLEDGFNRVEDCELVIK